MPKKHKLKHKITIEATFGSEFQKKAAMGALKVALMVWSTFYMNSHKENDIKILYGEEI